MARFEVSFDIAKMGGKAQNQNASVRVLMKGTNVAVAGPLWADRSSGATLTNPFTTAPGNVNFWLSTPQLVDLQITPAGGGATTFPNVPVSTLAPLFQPLRMGGAVKGWSST